MIWNRFYAPFLAISLFLCSCSKAGRKTNDKSLFVVEGKKTIMEYGKETLYYAVVNEDTLNLYRDILIN